MVDKSVSCIKHASRFKLVRTKDIRPLGWESLTDPFVIAQGVALWLRWSDFGWRSLPKSIRGIGLLLATACLFLSAQTLFAQTQRVPVTSSELSRQNMSHVAASVGQIVAVLHRDPGLMMELKKWIAKDATDHGQMISDADLADETIFERLETDMSFRAVATLLMQKYGYLQPTVNPDSAAGREEQLLIQERVRFLAQQSGGTAYTAPGQNPQQTGTCDPVGSNCTPGTSPSTSQPSQQPCIQTPTEMPGPASTPHSAG